MIMIIIIIIIIMNKSQELTVFHGRQKLISAWRREISLGFASCDLTATIPTTREIYPEYQSRPFYNIYI